MRARIVHGGAAVLLVLCLLGVRYAGEVPHYPVWIEPGLPAVVYEPERVAVGDAARLPVLVLSHGFAGSGSLLGSLARGLARQGFAVITFDSRGHGHNRLPFEGTARFVSEGMLDDLDAVVLWARSQPNYDGQRLAIGGHAEGGSLALTYAARRDPGVGAVVAISGSGSLDGPYTPPNVLLVWAERDSSALRAAARRHGAELISAARVVLDRTYGSFERGSAVRLAEIDGSNHLSILYSRAAAREIASWLAEALAPVPGAVDRPFGDTRMLWAALGLLAALVLLRAMPELIAPLCPQVPLVQLAQPWTGLGLIAASLAVSLALLAAVDPLTANGPLSAVPISDGRDVLGLLAIAGVGLLTFGARGARVRSQGLGDGRTWSAAVLLLGFVYVVGGMLCQPFWNPFLTAPRLLPWLAATGLLLPWFGASEWLLRGASSSPRWPPSAARLLTLVVLAGGAYAGLLPRLLLPTLLTIGLVFAVFEALALRISRVKPNPWLASLVQAGWTGWLLVAFFPSES